MGIFTPKWKTNDRSKQIKAVEAVRKVTNEKELRRIALEAPLPDVRMIAVYQMKDPALLKEMALCGDKYVSWAAIDNITDQNTLKEIACGNAVNAGRAVEKISNRDLLAEIVEKGASKEAREKAGTQLDFLNLLYETVETSGIDINQKVRHWTMKELLENFDFTDDTHAGKVVPAIISEMTGTGMIDKLVEACRFWIRSKDTIAESARLRKLELQFDSLDKDEFLIFRCKKCGQTVRYAGYFESELRDSWVEKGDYTCGCIEHPASTAGFPNEPAWEIVVSRNPIEGDKFRLCPVCMKPNSIDVRIKPLSRCNMLDGETDFQHLNKWKTEYYRLGFYIPWHRAKW